MVGAQHKETTMNVKDRQCLLTFLKKADGTSYYIGDVDGIYGRLSRKAIQDFQKDFCGLTVTGEADAVTDQAIIHAVAFGIPERDQTEDNEDVTDNNVGGSDQTGTFWDEIEFFDPEEMKCKCGGKYCDGYPHEIQPLLMQILDRARRWSGHPIVIVSGLRCKEWNRIQKGVATSQHQYGEAADVYFYGVSANTALEWLQSQPDVRYAYRIEGCNNIHFDIQPVRR